MLFVVIGVFLVFAIQALSSLVVCLGVLSFMNDEKDRRANAKSPSVDKRSRLVCEGCGSHYFHAIPYIPTPRHLDLTDDKDPD